MKQWWKIGIVIGMAVILAVASWPIKGNAQEDVPEELKQLYAQSAVLMDADSGRILFEKNGQQVRPMASTTKIMTLIITLEYADLDSWVTISEYAAGMPDVQLNVRKGEQYRLEDLLCSLMLESHNDSAVAIAEHVAANMQGKTNEKTADQRTKEESKALVADFAALMNAKARDIGCYDTHFVTPNGLDGEDEDGAHATTAADLARILRYCIMQSPKKDIFLDITRRENHTFSDQTGSRSYTVTNHNAFLQMMEGALTGKTGFTSQAGYCYVGALTRDGKTYIAALLACGWPNHKSYKWSDMKKLMNYGLENYTYHSFEEAGFDVDQLAPILVKSGQSEQLGEPIYVKARLAKGTSKDGYEANDETYDQQEMTQGMEDNADGVPSEAEDILYETGDGLLLREEERIQVKYQVESCLEAPVEAGMAVGSVQYLVDGQVFRTDLLVADGSVLRVDFFWCVNQVLQRYLV